MLIIISEITFPLADIELILYKFGQLSQFGKTIHRVAEATRNQKPAISELFFALIQICDMCVLFVWYGVRVPVVCNCNIYVYYECGWYMCVEYVMCVWCGMTWMQCGCYVWDMCVVCIVG